MQTRTRRILTTAGTVLVLGATGAFVASPNADAVRGHARAAHAKHGKHGKHLKGGLLKVAVQYIDIDRKALRQELPGHSLAQVAVAHGKTVAGLEAAMLAAAKERLDKAVAATELTQAQEDAVLAKLPARIDKLVNHVFKTK